MPGAETDAARRLAWLDEMAVLLWPGSEGVRRGAADFWLLPNASRPRLVIPSGSRRLASTAVRHYGEQLSWQSQLQAAGLSAGLRSGLAQRFLATGLTLTGADPRGGITAHLSEQLGRDVLVSLHLSAPRANRKPVLQLLSPEGDTVAFAKIGVDPRTSRLVRHEAEALRRLDAAGFSTVRTPPFLTHHVWNGLELLVLGALPVWHKRDSAPGRIKTAIREIAGLAPPMEQPLGSSAYLQNLRGRLDACAPTASRTALLEQLDQMTTRVGDQPVRFGAWHGDFTPWNSAPVDGQLLVWDWERLADPVPLGYDQLHHDLQRASVQEAVPLAQAATAAVDGAVAALRHLDVSGDVARTTAALYLTELGTRYLADDQAAAGGHGGRIEQWLVPVLRTAVGTL
jgi:hypothetical protein